VRKAWLQKGGPIEEEFGKANDSSTRTEGENDRSKAVMGHFVEEKRGLEGER